MPVHACAWIRCAGPSPTLLCIAIPATVLMHQAPAIINEVGALTLHEPAVAVSSMGWLRLDQYLVTVHKVKRLWHDICLHLDPLRHSDSCRLRRQQ